MIERQYGRLAVTPGTLITPLANEELATFTTDGMLAKRGFVPTDLIQRATSLVGAFAPVTTAQIQIRVPESDLPDLQPEKAMHVDGVACPHLDPHELRTFSLLVGIVLSDVSDPRGGVLCYVPGGHLRMAAWFRAEWSFGLGNPGDVVFLHHLVPHSVTCALFWRHPVRRRSTISTRFSCE